VKIDLRRITEQLIAESPCVAAVFCSYNFDPAYFEEQVLRAVLRVDADPEEATMAFLEESRRRLKETPVAVLVDASMRRPGRRLPYDQLLVRQRTFHPKLALLIFDDHARLLVGSANLTRSGFEQNLEAGFVRHLHYEDPADCETLREVRAFLARCVEIAAHPGTLLAQALESLDRRLPPRPARPPGRDHRLVSSFDAPILDQILALVSPAARLTHVGVLAPYFELDDQAIGTDTGLPSLLDGLVERAAGAVRLDVGVSWTDSPLDPGSTSTPGVEEHLDSLWAWRWREEHEGRHRDRIEYLVPTALTANQLAYRDAKGTSKRWPRSDMESALEARRLWPVSAPTLSLPDAILSHLGGRNDLHLWLHPATTFDEEGKVLRRPLHAKIFLLTSEHRGRSSTLLLLGSPNASRAAMLRDVASGGNVELGVVALLEGVVTLPDVLPDLVDVRLDQVRCIATEMTDGVVDLSSWIRDVAFDAAKEVLLVTWAEEGPSPLGNWVLRYGDAPLARGVEAPSEPTSIVPFRLRPDTAEVFLLAAGREWSLPIRVIDLAALPVNEVLTALPLRDLLALLGRRVGAERYSMLTRELGPTGTLPLLEAVFGDGFGPVDVFKAWWGLADALAEARSLASFRIALVGPLGAAAAWRALRSELESVVQGDRAALSRDEVWFYGAELVRTLQSVAIPSGPDALPKQRALDEMVRSLRADLDVLVPDWTERPWLVDVVRFYRDEVSDGRA
jgi:hypothetical protein